MIPNLFADKVGRCTLEGQMKQSIPEHAKNVNVTTAELAHRSGSKGTVAFRKWLRGWRFKIIASTPRRRHRRTYSNLRV